MAIGKASDYESEDFWVRSPGRSLFNLIREPIFAHPVSIHAHPIFIHAHPISLHKHPSKLGLVTDTSVD